MAIVICCSQKLLKRLRPPAKPPAPPPSSNPLRPWYADIDFIDRQPFVVLVNGATGCTLVLPGRADDLRQLHMMAGLQLLHLFQENRIGGALAALELGNWREPPIYAANRDRSQIAGMNQRKYEAWMLLEHRRMTAFEIAIDMLERPFSRKALGKDFHFAHDLLCDRLLPADEADECKLQWRAAKTAERELRYAEMKQRGPLSFG